MKQSQIFTKTRFEAPKDEVATNAEILIRAGFVHKEMAGAYTYLPLGLRTLKKIEQIIREEINKVGGQEMLLTALQSKELWEKTNRWDDNVVDNWFKTTLKNGSELGLGFSHEEPLTNLLKDHVRSYKDLPIAVYQFQTKFRNESRAKSGILRGREFLMKDLYTFSKTEAEHIEIYEKIKGAYLTIFKRAGIGDKTFVTTATGGTFSQFSHEFQTITDAGEDIIYVDENTGESANKELWEDPLAQDLLKVLKHNVDSVKQKKSIEVGNIFSLGTKFSSALDLTFIDEKGESKNPIMGCYGIGVGRLMGTVVEVLSTEKGMTWPEEIAPYKVHLIDLSQGDEVIKAKVDEFYKKLQEAKIEVLLDDREARAGEKFADADLIGIPHRIVMSKKTEAGDTVEYTNRITEETVQISKEEIISKLK